MFPKDVLHIIYSIIHKSNIDAVNREYHSLSHIYQPYVGYFCLFLNHKAYNHRFLKYGTSTDRNIYRGISLNTSSVSVGELPKNY